MRALTQIATAFFMAIAGFVLMMLIGPSLTQLWFHDHGHSEAVSAARSVFSLVSPPVLAAIGGYAGFHEARQTPDHRLWTLHVQNAAVFFGLLCFLFG